MADVTADLRSIRKRLGELEADRAEREKDLRVSLVAVALAAAMLALTAATWATLEDDDGEIGYTLWGLVGQERWFALVTLGLLVIVAVATMARFASSTVSKAGQVALVVLSLAAAGAAMLIGMATPEDAGTGPGRWLAALGALALAFAHGSRVGEERYR